MEKQRQSADPAAVMHSATLHRQAKSRVTLRALVPVNSQAIRQFLLRAKSQPQAKLLVAQLARPPLLEH
jgi:hypothetical protein